jgi:hypothetical protein
MRKSCIRKAYLKYVLRVPPDCEEDQSAFFFGTVFHRYLEDTMHTPEPVETVVSPGMKSVVVPCYVSQAKLDLAWDAEIVEAHQSVKDWDVKKVEVTKLQIASALQTFFMRHVKSGLKAVGCEVEIAHKNLIAYVDVVYTDPSGTWWIGDLKTASSLNAQALQASLHKNLQLSIYATYKEDIAKILNLDVKKFGGVRYLSTTKSKAAVIRPFKEFACKNTSESYDIVVPQYLLADVTPTLDDQLELVEKLEALASLGTPASQVSCNYGACFDYFRPCIYWSHCYGQKFGEESGVKVYTTASKYETTTVDEDEAV